MREIRLGFRVKRPILACGADLKGAFALAKGKRAFLFEGFGDLGDPDNLERYKKAIASAIRKTKIAPEVVACDMHPGYFSRGVAEDYARYATHRTLYEVQHHEAHIAGTMVDGGIRDEVIGVAFDGTGFGSDGNIWGGEFFIGSPPAFKRVAHLEYLRMPGGEAAIREPWRMVEAYLYRAGYRSPSANIRKMIDKGINSPLTSSAGRLFDAVGSIVLEKRRAAFEAELPIELERMVYEDTPGSYSFDIKNERGSFIISFSKTVRGVMKDSSKGLAKGAISAKFHNTVAEAILDTAKKIRGRFKIDKVVLSGGVFQNIYLKERTKVLLRKNGFDLNADSGVPINDSGIPIGQIAIANLRGVCA